MANDDSTHETFPGDLSQRSSAPEPAPTGLDAPLIEEVTQTTFEAMVERSLSVPIVVDLWAAWCQPCKQLKPILEELVAEYAGRFQLVTIDIDASPQIAQALEVQSVPTVMAVIGGRPIPLFQGAQPKAQVRAVLDQVLTVASQMGVTGTIAVSAEAEPELTEEEQEILAAIEAGDYDDAIERLHKAITNNPEKKTTYTTQLAQVELQARLAQAEAADESDPFVLADQFIAHGNEPAAYDILLERVRLTQGEDREAARERLVELMRVGSDAEAIKEARSRLTRLLF